MQFFIMLQHTSERYSPRTVELGHGSPVLSGWYHDWLLLPHVFGKNSMGGNFGAENIAAQSAEQQ